MCLIVKLPPNARLSHDQVADAIKYNPDGVGIMYATPRGCVARRTMAGRADKIMRFLAHVPDGVEYAVHFRRVTRGGRSINNVHPFPINDRYMLMHNGTFESELAPVEAYKGMSDSQYVASFHLGEQHEATLESEPFWSFFEAAVGYNRVLVLDGDKRAFRVINEVLWHENPDGWLLSNNYAIKNGDLWGIKAVSPYTSATSYGYSGYTATPSPSPSPSTSTRKGIDSYKWYDTAYKDFLGYRRPVYSGGQEGFFYPVSTELAKAFPHDMTVASEILTRAASRNTYSRFDYATASTLLIAYLYAGEDIRKTAFVMLADAEKVLDRLIEDVNAAHIRDAATGMPGSNITDEITMLIVQAIQTKAAKDAAATVGASK